MSFYVKLEAECDRCGKKEKTRAVLENREQLNGSVHTLALRDPEGWVSYSDCSIIYCLECYDRMRGRVR